MDRKKNDSSHDDEHDGQMGIDHLSAIETETKVDELERMVKLLLASSLRGRLLPADRKMIKSYLGSKAKERRKAIAARPGPDGPVCPVCRLPIPDENAERCPNCSVLLDVVRQYRTSE